MSYKTLIVSGICAEATEMRRTAAFIYTDRTAAGRALWWCDICPFAQRRKENR